MMKNKRPIRNLAELKKEKSMLLHLNRQHTLRSRELSRELVQPHFVGSLMKNSIVGLFSSHAPSNGETRGTPRNMVERYGKPLAKVGGVLLGSKFLWGNKGKLFSLATLVVPMFMKKSAMPSLGKFGEELAVSVQRFKEHRRDRAANP